MKKWLSLIVIFQFLNFNLAFAEQEDVLAKTREDILIVVAAGAGGAVLGLSTLSFVDMPSKSLYNIWAGASIGIAIGVAYVAYHSAQQNSEDLVSAAAEKDFSTSSREQWHLSKIDTNLNFNPTFSTSIWQTQF